MGRPGRLGCLRWGASFLLLVASGLVPGAASGSPAIPRARSSMALTTAPGSSVLLFGGDYYDRFGDVHMLGDTWTWDGSRWTEQHPSDSPSPRCCMGVAYDLANGEVVLYGGSDGYSYLGDTWTWDGSTWTEQHPPTSPPAGAGMAMAYDAARGEVVMFGGEGVGQETWTWDGTSWTEEHPDIAPPWRERAGVAYDSDRQEVVMFGGLYFCFEDDCYWHDTWTWDGSNWTKQSPDHMPARRGLLGMAFDASTGNTVMFGGEAYGTLRGDTWVWDGSDWTLQQPAGRPPRREAMGMTWDAARDQVLLFGGRTGSGPGFFRDFNGTWVWDGATWTCVSGLCS